MRDCSHRKLCLIENRCNLSPLCSALWQGHLYVGTELEVQRIPLADCGRYGVSCRECILSRDPYCAWDKVKNKCTAIPPDFTPGYIFYHKNINKIILNGPSVRLLLFGQSIKLNFLFVLMLFTFFANRSQTLIQTLDHSNASVCGDVTGKLLKKIDVLTWYMALTVFVYGLIHKKQ